ncbi:MAG: response regulator [Rubrobacter sp.]|nr:response regulator [Rubrobacter sp.]
MGKTILMVEDDEDQVALTVRAFKKHGIMGELEELVIAHNGGEALDYMMGEGAHAGRDTNEMPEFVLLDMNLPGMNGLEILERLRSDERTSLVPSIIFSSSHEHHDIVEGYRRGANSYVTKPDNYEKFSEAMRHLGWYWLDWNENPSDDE